MVGKRELLRDITEGLNFCKNRCNICSDGETHECKTAVYVAAKAEAYAYGGLSQQQSDTVISFMKELKEISKKGIKQSEIKNKLTSLGKYVATTEREFRYFERKMPEVQPITVPLSRIAPHARRAIAYESF